MALYKRGRVWWYEFQFRGQRIRESAQTGDKRAAQQIEAARRVALAKGEAGIAERPLAATLAEFAPRFTAEIETVCAEKRATVDFYKEELRRLLENRKLAALRLNEIDEPVIDGYKQQRTRQASLWDASFTRGDQPRASHSQEAAAFTARVESNRSRTAD